jgi:hypothetical protein
MYGFKGNVFVGVDVQSRDWERDKVLFSSKTMNIIFFLHSVSVDKFKCDSHLSVIIAFDSGYLQNCR